MKDARRVPGANDFHDASKLAINVNAKDMDGDGTFDHREEEHGPNFKKLVDGKEMITDKNGKHINSETHSNSSAYETTANGVIGGSATEQPQQT